MSQDFETLNKQIAAFIVVSAAVSVPAYAGGGIGFDTNSLVPTAQEQMVVKYAGPGMIVPTKVEDLEPMVVKYAGPGMIVPTPMEPQEPMIVRYAGPPDPTPPINLEISDPSDSGDILEQTKQFNNPENLRVIDSADSVTIYSSEDDHEYRATKVAPGRFRFW